MNRNELKTQTTIIYLVADCIELISGKSPDMSGLLYLFNSGDTSRKLSLKDQIIASDLYTLFSNEITGKQLNFEYFQRFLKNNFHLNVKIDHNPQSISDCFEMADHVSGQLSSIYFYYLLNIYYIRNSQSPIVHNVKRFLNAFKKHNANILSTLQRESESLLSAI